MPEFEHQDTSRLDDSGYQDYILQGVSRTFALTIPQLPVALREVVGNAYLLCRLADTIEDDPALPAGDKKAFSERLIGLIDGRDDSAAFAAGLASVLVPETPVAEQDLVQNTARVIRLTHTFSENQRAAISRCVATMTAGMAHYQANPPHAGLEDMRKLDDYCYHVAGVVGEMLTELFCDYCEAMRARRDVLMPLAVSFGQGLQMTNILKDIWDDRSRSICWLPRSLFKRHGLELSELETIHGSPAFAEGLNELLGVTHAHLRNALDYTLMIPATEKGIRHFCLWCIGMAMLSIRKIHHNPGFSAGAEVKISRRAVYTVIALCNLCGASNTASRLLFNLTAAGLPKAIASGAAIVHIPEGSV
ncbi:MAG: phytoene/squalene synthase family protein [Pseudomonadales bacterium]|nr:phytoene/squalene synthase family protein [Pseudomonadales bacterium]